MGDMSDKETKFLESFKPGEYAQLTLLVKLKDMTKFIDHMKKAGVDMAILPNVQANIDFHMNDKGDVH